MLPKVIKSFIDKPSLKAGWLFLIIVIAFIPQVFITRDIVQNSMMTDFYSRFIGSRLLNEYQSPYFLPNAGNVSNAVNGVTATPLVLWLEGPIAKLNYCEAKLVWWAIEEGLLFITIFFTCLYPEKLIRQFITIIVAFVFFCYSRNWFVHVFAGQYYIFFACIFSIISYYYKTKKPLPLLVFPFAGLLRPFFVLGILPFLLKNFRVNLKWTTTGIALSLVVLFASGTYKLTGEYNHALKTYASEITGWTNGSTKKSMIDVANPDCTSQNYKFENFHAASLFSLQHYLKLIGLSIDSPIFFSTLLLVILCLFVLLTYKTIVISSENIMITSFLFYMLGELFAPANRNPYDIVQYLGILGLTMQKANHKIIVLIVIGLAFNHSFPISFKYQREIGEAVMLIGIYLSLFAEEEKPV